MGSRWLRLGMLAAGCVLLAAGVRLFYLIYCGDPSPEISRVPKRVVLKVHIQSTDRLGGLAAEHFCPACPKALFTMSATATSKSALGVTMRAFFPLVSARSGRSAQIGRASCRERV